MAKKTKDSNLSIEERLEQALIPNWDEPYKLPSNWCWINLKSVLSHQSGNSKLIKGKLSSEKSAGFYDAYSASGQDVYTESYEHEGDAIIVSAVGARCGKAFLASGKWSAIANTHIIYSNDRLIDIRYLHYILNDESWWVKSGSAQPFIVVNESLLRPFPLPPLQEQQRIITRIESFFTKLDEAKEKAQEVVNGYEVRKDVIFHRAFAGDLTTKWRLEHGVGLGSWETVEISDRFDVVGGIQKKPSRIPKDNPVPYLTVANVFRNRIDLSEIRYFEVFEGELEKLKLEEKDILVVEGNGSANEIGRCAMWNGELPLCIHQNHIIRLRAKNHCTHPEYVLYFLNSENGRRLMRERAKTTAGLFNLSTGKIKTIPVPFASPQEQVEIVNILNDLCEKEQQAKETAEAVIEQIDTMKKAILARAFRGELGTNDPDEENAVELLKKVLGGDAAVQTPAKKPTKRISIPSDIKELLSNIREEEIIKLLLKASPQPVSIQEIMSLSSKKFELMDALRSLEKKHLITKNESGDYSLTR